MYIGDVYIPAITELSLDSQQQVVKEFKGLGLNHAVSISFSPPDIRKATLHASLYAVSPKSAADFAKDLLALLRNAGYNYINFGEHKGLLEIDSIDTPMPATSQLVRDATIYGLFLPNAHYLRRLNSSPAILTNDGGLTLASAGVDSLVWLPSGASVVAGGDGTTYARTTKDGSITGVLAETIKYVDFEDCNEYSVGEVVVWDEVDDATEGNWIRVFNIDHEFTGDTVIENGLIRVRLREGATEASTLSVYYSDAWHVVSSLVGWLAADDYLYFKLLHIDTFNPDKVVVDGQFHDGTTYKDVQLTLQRGSFMLSVKSVDAVEVGLISITARRLAYVEGDTPIDAWVEAGTGWDAGSDADNYVAAIQTAATPTDILIQASTEDSLEAYSNHATDLITATGCTLVATQYAFLGCVPYAKQMYYEGEDGTPSAGAATGEIVGAYPADETNVMILDAANEKSAHTISSLCAVASGCGTYRLIARIKCTAVVVNDFTITFTNDAGDSSTSTTAVGWQNIETDFTLATADVAQAITVEFTKDQAGDNTIDVDYFVIIPISLDTSKQGIRDLAHQALINQHIQRQTTQR